jgi:hypothetical protein
MLNFELLKCKSTVKTLVTAPSGFSTQFDFLIILTARYY